MIALIAVLVLITGLVALSWGPGTHIRLARRAIREVDMSPYRRRLIEENEVSFLYGNIAADLITWKHYGGRENSCHHWSIEERLLEHIESDADRAFVLGYTCHLAADIAAHHHLVPYHLVRALPPKILAHGYWEARVDRRFVEEPTWHELDELRVHRELRQHDELVRRAVPKRALSMGSNRFIFDHVILAQSKSRIRRAMERVGERVGERRAPGTVVDDVVEQCLESASSFIATWLTHESIHPLIHLDPSGHDALREARRMRRELNRQYLVRQDAVRASIDAAKRFEPLESPLRE